jgi:hypothetical protein|tara:strand:+ start:3153 stop:3773 length:621 start_codon:yes stop_codon:yes gene_type:complete
MFIRLSITNTKNLKDLYKDYFQKSKVFLYPLLNIKKGVKFVPCETYMSWDNIYNIDDYHLVCIYDIPDAQLSSFKLFEEKYIITNKNYKAKFNLEYENKIAIIFNLTKYKYDIDRLIKGEYSKISLKTKELITEFFGEHGKIAEYVESYLHPTYWHEDYAELLAVDIKYIHDVHELCDLPNLEKECFKYNSNELQLFKQKFISLQS